MTTATAPNVLRQTLPLLTAEEERAIGLRIRAGIAATKSLGGRVPETDEERELEALAIDGKEAFDRLVLSNIRLVTYLVGKLRWFSGMQRTDAEQYGIVGLMTAARRYDPAKYPSGRFSTYAMWWIRNTVLKALVAEGAIIRVPHYLFNAAKLMRLERDVPASIKVLVAKHQAIVVLNAGDAHMLSDDIVSPPEGTNVTEDGEALTVAMAGLPARERSVIEARYYRHETLEVVGVTMGISKERVRQIEDRALRRLRESMVARELAV